MRLQTYDKLAVCSLTPEFHARTCNYWYTVTNGGTAHTAFTTRAGLFKWLEERGLSLTQELPPEREHAYIKIAGSYSTMAHLDYDAFASLAPVLTTRTLSNGDYVVAKITQDANGHRTEHTLNPNCRDRQVFDYRESAVLMR